jgi:ribosomal protein S18 acetylase RimI-like enzyme
VNRHQAAFRLAAEHGLRFASRGRSMWPLLRPGDLTIAEPLTGAPREGDVLVYRKGTYLIAHRFIGLLSDGRLRLHGDFLLDEDPPLAPTDVLGRVVAIERDGRRISLDSGLPRVLAFALPPLRRHAPRFLRSARAALSRAANRFDHIHTAAPVRALLRKLAPPFTVGLADDAAALRAYHVALGGSGNEYAALEPGEFTVVAKIGDRIAGCTHVLDPPWTRAANLAGDLWIHDTQVGRRYQGLGIGRAVTEFALAELRRRGIGRVRVAIRPENRRSQLLHESVGFVSIGLLGGHQLYELALARQKGLG